MQKQWVRSGGGVRGWEAWGMAKPPHILGKVNPGERWMGQDYLEVPAMALGLWPLLGCGPRKSVLLFSWQYHVLDSGLDQWSPEGDASQAQVGGEERREAGLPGMLWPHPPLCSSLEAAQEGTAAMNKEKAHVNITVISHVDSGKSATTTGHLF